MDLFARVSKNVIIDGILLNVELFLVDNRFLIRVADSKNIITYDKYFDRFINASEKLHEIVDNKTIDLDEFIELY